MQRSWGEERKGNPPWAACSFPGDHNTSWVPSMSHPSTPGCGTAGKTLLSLSLSFPRKRKWPCLYHPSWKMWVKTFWVSYKVLAQRWVGKPECSVSPSSHGQSPDRPTAFLSNSTSQVHSTARRQRPGEAPAEVQRGSKRLEVTQQG